MGGGNAGWNQPTSSGWQTELEYERSHPNQNHKKVQSPPKAIFDQELNNVAKQYRDARPLGPVPRQVSTPKSYSHVVKTNVNQQQSRLNGHEQSYQKQNGQREQSVKLEVPYGSLPAVHQEVQNGANRSNAEPAGPPGFSRNEITTLPVAPIQRDDATSGYHFNAPRSTFSPPPSNYAPPQGTQLNLSTNRNACPPHIFPNQDQYCLNDPSIQYSASFQPQSRSSYPESAAPGNPMQAYYPQQHPQQSAHVSFGNFAIQQPMPPNQGYPDHYAASSYYENTHSQTMNHLATTNHSLMEDLARSKVDYAQLQEERSKESLRLKEVEECNLSLHTKASDLEASITTLAKDLEGSKAHCEKLQSELVKRGQQQKERSNKAVAKAQEVAKLKDEKHELEQQLHMCRKVHDVEINKLKLDVETAHKQKGALASRADADVKIVARLNADIDGLVEKVKQLEIQAAFNKVGGDSVDVPARLDGIFRILDELPESILEQISEKQQDGGLKNWKGDLNQLPARVVDFYHASKLVKSTTAQFIYYGIQMLVMYYIKAEIWDTQFHPVVCRKVHFDSKLCETARKLDETYQALLETEPYIKACNWRVLSSQAMWKTVAKALGKGSLESALYSMTSEHVEFITYQLVPNLVTASPMHPLDFYTFRQKLSEIIKEVTQLKYEVQTRDARYEYSLEVPSLPHDSFKTLTLGTPISCKTPRYIRWETSSDSKASRVSKVQQEATYHTAGDAGWVAKPKKS